MNTHRRFKDKAHDYNLVVACCSCGWKSLAVEPDEARRWWERHAIQYCTQPSALMVPR
jgi:hypothetical protein